MSAHSNNLRSGLQIWPNAQICPLRSRPGFNEHIPDENSYYLKHKTYKGKLLMSPQSVIKLKNKRVSQTQKHIL